MKVKDLIALLQQQDQEAIAVVCGMDGAGYVAASVVEPHTLVKVESCCGDFADASNAPLDERSAFDARSAPFNAVYIE
jgi:hypothetical protein